MLRARTGATVPSAAGYLRRGSTANDQRPRALKTPAPPCPSVPRAGRASRGGAGALGRASMARRVQGRARSRCSSRTRRPSASSFPRRRTTPTLARLPEDRKPSSVPNLVPGVSLIPPGGQTPNDWINAAAFSTPAAGTYGNAGRNLVRAPGLWQTDLALSKKVPVTERLRAEFRAEAFNLFNRAQYGSPSASLSSPLSFGVITTLVNQGATGSGT